MVNILEWTTIAGRKIESSGLSGAVSTGFEELYRYVLPKLGIIDSDSFGIVQDHDMQAGQFNSTVQQYPVEQKSGAQSEKGVRVPRRMILPDQSSFSDVESHRITQSQLFEVPNSYIIAPDALAVSCTYEILKPVIAPSYSSAYRTDIALSNLFVKQRELYNDLKNNRLHRRNSKKLEVACPLVTFWPNYYHWMAECMTKLHSLDSYEQQTGRRPTLVLPSNPSSWMLESLKCAGYSSDEWLICDEGVFEVDRLVFPTYPEPSPDQCHWLREQMSETSSSVNKNKRIFISREGATRRRVENESTVLEMLYNYGFESYKLEELPVRTQVELFNSAEMVVAPHGAGTVNMIFSHDPVLIELFGRKRKTTFYRLAEMLDISYESIDCPSNNADIVVDVDQLESVLNKYLNRKGKYESD